VRIWNTNVTPLVRLYAGTVRMPSSGLLSLIDSTPTLKFCSSYLKTRLDASTNFVPPLLNRFTAPFWRAVYPERRRGAVLFTLILEGRRFNSVHTNQGRPFC
jgi:hypothetical protein